LDINTIGFRLGPRINAAGRIDDPYYALQLLLQDTDDEKAKTLAEHLDNLNTKRQKMVLDALEQLEERLLTREKKNQIIVAWDKDWHVGILGLLAAKCVEKYNVPAIIMQDFGDYLVGSSRGPEWFNLVEALTKHSDLLENFGGHIQAAGFTIPKSRVEQFNAKMKAYAHDIIENTDWRPTLEIDAVIKEEEIEEGLMLLLDQLEPFGIGNEQPLLLFRGVNVDELKRVGKELNHLHFKAQLKGKRLPVIGFKLGKYEDYLREHNRVDLACYLERNEWKGIKKLQLRLVDVMRSEV
jgi:single-stranded-DNA-specific exonuclease